MASAPFLKVKSERMAAPTCLLTCQLVNQQGRKGG